MANIGIYYGSATGSTEEVAEEIAKKLHIDKINIHDVSNAKADFSDYDILLFGSSTQGYGDLTDEWEDFIEKVKGSNLKNKKVAIFGCGDASSYSDTFCDAVGKIYEVVKAKDCQIIGRTSTDGYSYEASEALVDGQFIGLLIDNDNEPEMTSQRISCWVEDLQKAI